jgi:hypothetical protein
MFAGISFVDSRHQHSAALPPADPSLNHRIDEWKSKPYYASQRRFTLASGWLLPGNLSGIADRPQLAYSVEKLRFQRRQKNCRPLEASLHFGRGGRRDFVMRATKNLLTDLPAIHTAN